VNAPHSAEKDAGLTFKVTVPHDPNEDWHQWYFPNGQRGIGPIEKRDKAGRAKGKRDGFYPDWFVLACNNTGCSAEAVVPVRLVLDHADLSDPCVNPPAEPAPLSKKSSR